MQSACTRAHKDETILRVFASYSLGANLQHAKAKEMFA